MNSLPLITRYTGPLSKNHVFLLRTLLQTNKNTQTKTKQPSQRMMSLCFTKLYLITPMPAGQHNIPARVNSHATQEIST